MFLPPELVELIKSFTVRHKFVEQLRIMQEIHKVERKFALEDAFSEFLDACEGEIEEMNITGRELQMYFKMMCDQTYGRRAFTFPGYCNLSPPS